MRKFCGMGVRRGSWWLTAAALTIAATASQGAEQTLRGVLMDGSCPAIAGGAAGGVAGSGPGPASPTTSTPGAGATATGPGTTEAYSGTGVAGTAGANTPPPPMQDGTVRSRTAEEPMSPSFLKVRDKYRDCMVKAGSKQFALHADGKLYVLDPASNELVQERMSSGAFAANTVDKAGAPKWMGITMVGEDRGGKLAVSSMKAGTAE